MALLIMTLSAAGSFPTEGKFLTAFDAESPDLGWVNVNDNVMGGRSSGGFRVENERLLWAGSTNTTGGGFSSIRTTVRQPDLDASRGLRLKVRGDGRTYTFRLGTSEPNVSWWFRFSTEASDEQGGWQEVELPLTSFWANRRGRPVQTGPLAPADIQRLGILINDGEDGPFRLEIDWIKAFE